MALEDKKHIIKQEQLNSNKRHGRLAKPAGVGVVGAPQRRGDGDADFDHLHGRGDDLHLGAAVSRP